MPSGGIGVHAAMIGVANDLVRSLWLAVADVFYMICVACVYIFQSMCVHENMIGVANDRVRSLWLAVAGMCVYCMCVCVCLYIYIYIYIYIVYICFSLCGLPLLKCFV